MRRDNTTFCDSPACTEPDRIIKPNDPGRLSYGKVDYHAQCYRQKFLKRPEARA